MGCAYGFSDSDTNYNSKNTENFTIKRKEHIGNYYILKVHYPNCTNYNGYKILVLESKYKIDFEWVRRLNPHCIEDTTHGIKLIARFFPTDEGWSIATFLCTCLTRKELNND